MENNNQTPGSPQPMNSMPPQSTPTPITVGGMGMNGSMEKKSGIGSIIATVVIIALIILGGLYFWGKRIETEKATQAMIQNGSSTTTEETTAAIQATQIETVSQDDSLNTIDSETKTTQTSNLSPELQ